MYMEKWREVKCNGQRIRVVKYGQKKQSCLRKFAGWNVFHGSPARIVKTKNEDKKKTKPKTRRQKAKETKTGKSNGIQWYRLRICSVYF